jgi:hypothetical protein
MVWALACPHRGDVTCVRPCSSLRCFFCVLPRSLQQVRTSTGRGSLPSTAIRNSTCSPRTFRFRFRLAQLDQVWPTSLRQSLARQCSQGESVSGGCSSVPWLGSSTAGSFTVDPTWSIHNTKHALLSSLQFFFTRHILSFSQRGSAASRLLVRVCVCVCVCVRARARCVSN